MDVQARLRHIPTAFKSRNLIFARRFFNRIGLWVCDLCFLCIFTQGKSLFWGYEHPFLRAGWWCVSSEMKSLQNHPSEGDFSYQQRDFREKTSFSCHRAALPTHFSSTPALYKPLNGTEEKFRQSLENIQRRRSGREEKNHFKGLI